jgi:hypothetical protein
MLTLTNAQTSDGGIYRVVAATPDGSYTSSNAVLTVFTSNPNDPPVFVAFRTSQVASGTTPTSATTSTINAPGSGWSYSAAARVAGTTWNQILRPNPLFGSGSENGTTGTFTCNSADNIGLTSATGGATNVKLTMNIVVADLETGANASTRVEPNTGSGGNTVLGPNGLMNNAWRIYRSGNSSITTVTGLTPNAHYLLYVYGSITTTGQGCKFTLNSHNVGSDDVASKSTAGGNSGNIFSTDGSTYSLTAAGTTWQQFHAVANGSGTLVITTARNSTSAQYYNGLQLVQYPLPVITAQPPTSVQGAIGGSVSIAVSVTNGAGASGSLNYQWQKATDSGSTFHNIAPNVNASAATATLALSSIQNDDVGLYRVLVTNSLSGGTVISTASSLVIDPERAFVESYGLDPATNGAPAADPDLDGIANRLEFFLGGDPTMADTGILPVSSYKSAADGGPALVFEFNRDTEADGVSYTVEYTTDLAGAWTTAVNGVNGITIVTTAIDANNDHITATIPSASSKLFARLRL